MNDIDVIKKSLRSKFKAIRQAITPMEHLVLDGAISALLLNLPEFINADVVAGYVSDGTEVNLRGVLEKALQLNKAVALPRYNPEQKVYEQVLITSFADDLVPGKYGLLEPRSDLPRAEMTARSCCLVPALAFDGKGNRLGRGGGFYDRLLKDFPGAKIGVFYQSQYSSEPLAIAEHDQKLTMAVTENKVYKF